MLVNTRSTTTTLAILLAMTTSFASIRAEDEVTYAKDIAPLWQRSCSACHNAKKAEGGLNLETSAALLKGSDSGSTIVPGKSDESEIIKRVIATDDSFMPPKNNSAGAKPLTEKEIALVRRWIDSGAKPGDDSAPQNIVWSAMPGTVRSSYAVDASADGQFAAIGRANQIAIYQWPTQVAKPSAIALVDPAVQSSGVGAPAAHLDIVQSLAFCPDSMRLATGGYRAVKIWKREISAKDDPLIPADATAIRLSGDRSLMAAALGNGSVAIIEVASQKVVQTLPAQAGKPIAMAWLQNNGLAVISDAPALQVWSWSNEAAPATIASPLPSAAKQVVPVTADKLFVLLADGSVQLANKTAPAAEGTSPSYALAQLAEPLAGVSAIELLPGEKLKLLVVKRDAQVQVFDVESTKSERGFKVTGEVVQAALDPTGTQLATLTADHVVRVWNVVDGKELKTLNRDGEMSRTLARAKRDVTRQESWIEKLAASLKEIEAANQKEQEVLKKLTEQRDKAAMDLAAKVADIEKNTTAMKAAEAGITASEQAIAAEMKKIEAYKAEIEAKKKDEEKLAKNKDTAAAELAKQEQAMGAGKDSAERAAALVPAQQKKIEDAKLKLTSFQANVETVIKLDTADKQEEVKTLAFTADSNHLVLVKKPGKIDILSNASGSKVAELLSGFDSVDSVAILAERLVAAKNGAASKSWSGNFAWTLERTIGSETDPKSILSDRVTSLAFSPDGQTLAVGSGPASRFGDLKTFNTSTGELVRDYGEVHSDTILDIAYSPDGTQLATCGADKIIKVYEVGAEKHKLTLEGHTHHVLALAWQDNARVLASASADGALKVWDITTGEQQRTVQGFSKEITSLQFVGSTNQVVASCADNSLRLVDVTNGQTARNFGGSASPLFAVSVSGDGKNILAGGQDGKLYIWAVEKAELQKSLE